MEIKMGNMCSVTIPGGETQRINWRGWMEQLDKAYMGKRLDNFEWVFGYYLCIRGEKDRHFIIQLGSDASKVRTIWDLGVEVDPETIEPARLVDMTGRIIDVGDIVKQRIMKHPSEVFFDYEESAFGMKNSDGKIAMLSPEFTRAHLKVIGNIKDNPELMLGEIAE